MPIYRTRTYVPPLVQQALDLARQQGFKSSCVPEVGQLLGILASHVQHGIVGEIGTGTGVSSAWMLSHLSPTIRFVTVEANVERATAVQHLFQDLPNTQVIHGDWSEILAYGPFDLLFIDAGPAKSPPRSSPREVTAAEAAEMILPALRMGGIAVLDDLSPEEYWPEEWRGQPDLVREFWLNDTRLNAMEVLVKAATSAMPRPMVILATRIG
jgi:predicted O-methyltransferase YrrM